MIKLSQTHTGLKLPPSPHPVKIYGSGHVLIRLSGHDLAYIPVILNVPAGLQSKGHPVN